MARLENMKDDDILQRAKKFKSDAENYWQPIYQQGLEDKEFVTVKGGQWDSEALAKRQAQGKPTLEINLVRSYVQQQINIMRQNRPQAKVVPVDSGADVEIAKLLEGLIKDVEEASNFEDALDVASANQVHSGIGFYRIETDYIDETSFLQEPRFKPIENPQAVLIDPLSKALDGSDMTQAMICEWLDKDDVIRQYGEDCISDFDSDNNNVDWYTENTVCVAEYFYIDHVKDVLLQLADGTIAFKSEFSDDELANMVINQRETYRKEIQWVKCTADKVLEKSVFPGKYIPIFPVYGEVTWIGNQRHVFSLVHFAKDAQRLFNYWKSTEAHILQKNQDDILIVDDRGIAGYNEWQNPSAHHYLRFNSYDMTTQTPIAYPTRLGSATPPTGILNASENAKALIPDILNMHAPQMGQDVNAQSGRAIGLLQRQADTAQFHFQDNVNKTIRHSARVLIGLFPILYDVEMVRRVIGADGSDELVKINAQPQTPDEHEKAINGILNDLSIGRFDVRMDTGPSFNTQREQSFQLMMQLVQTNPNLFNLIADLMMRNSPLMNATEMAERVKMLIPPQALGKEQIDPEQAKAQIAQLDQLVQQQMADIQSLQVQLQDKELDRQLEMAKIQLQAEKDIQVAQINASSRADVQELRSVAELIQKGIDYNQAPPNWLQQGDGVGDYRPDENIDFGSLGDEPDPNTITDFNAQPPNMEFMQDENLNNPLANQEMQPPTDVQTGGGFFMPDDGSNLLGEMGVSAPMGGADELTTLMSTNNGQ